MLRLELDWAGDDAPPFGDDDEHGVRVEHVTSQGPSGWPVIAVYALASGSDGGPLLWSWLRDVYGEDDDGASDLASLANDV